MQNGHGNRAHNVMKVGHSVLDEEICKCQIVGCIFLIVLVYIRVMGEQDANCYRSHEKLLQRAN